MTRIEKSIEIRAPPERVWEMLALDRPPEWMDALEMESGKYTSEVRTPEDKYRVGASAHITEKRWEYDAEITESLENEKITARSKGRKKHMVFYTYILKPVEEGTKLTWVGEYEMPWGILGKALGPLARREGERKGERALAKLKGILEK